MEYVNFYPKTFHQIPEQDNPAFDPNVEPVLMIVSSANTNKTESNDQAVVLYIEKNEVDSVNHVAKFWRLKDAKNFCDTYIR